MKLLNFGKIKINNTSYRDFVHFRDSGDGSVFGMWCSSHTPSGLETLVLTGNSTKNYYEHDSVGFIVPSLDGEYLYTGNGLYTSQLKRVQKELPNNMVFIPATQNNYFIGVNKKAGQKKVFPFISFFIVGNSQPFFSIPKIDEFEWGNTNRSRKTTFTFDKRFRFIPQADSLVMIPFTNDRLIIKNVNIIKSIEKSGIDYLFVDSSPITKANIGEEYSYQISVKSRNGGISYTLDSAPAGMSISRTGLISWHVPIDYHGNSEEYIIITISDDSGQEIIYNYKLLVEDTGNDLSS